MAQSNKQKFKDPDFRKEWIGTILFLFLRGQFEECFPRFRTYLNATQSLPEFAQEINKGESSVRRMLSRKGNPSARNFGLLYRYALQKEQMSVGLMDQLKSKAVVD